MPPPAVDPASADDAAAPPTLHDAAARLESALARLEALVDAGPLQSELFRAREAGGAEDDALAGGDVGALKAELDAIRERERALRATASAASDALGRAMTQVRHFLDADGLVADEDDPPPDPADDAQLDLAIATAEDDRP